MYIYICESDILSAIESRPNLTGAKTRPADRERKENGKNFTKQNNVMLGKPTSFCDDGEKLELRRWRMSKLALNVGGDHEKGRLRSSPAAAHCNYRVSPTATCTRREVDLGSLLGMNWEVQVAGTAYLQVQHLPMGTLPPPTGVKAPLVSTILR